MCSLDRLGVRKAGGNSIQQTLVPRIDVAVRGVEYVDYYVAVLGHLRLRCVSLKRLGVLASNDEAPDNLMEMGGKIDQLLPRDLQPAFGGPDLIHYICKMLVFTKVTCRFEFENRPVEGAPIKLLQKNSEIEIDESAIKIPDPDSLAHMRPRLLSVLVGTLAPLRDLGHL